MTLRGLLKGSVGPRANDSRQRGHVPGDRVRHDGGAEAGDGPEPGQDRAGGLRAVVPGDPTAVGLLRGQVRHPRIHRLPADDPRTIATLEGVARELTQDGYCYRYRPDERPLGESEGAFVMCGFLMALAYSQQGEPVRAARWFERNRAASGPAGLLSEEFDVLQRQMRGNLPQAFHALLFQCAVTEPSAT